MLSQQLVRQEWLTSSADRSCCRRARPLPRRRLPSLRHPVEDLLHGICLPESVVLRGDKAQVQLVSNLPKGQPVSPELSQQADYLLFLVALHEPIIDANEAERYLPLAVAITVSVVAVQASRHQSGEYC